MNRVTFYQKLGEDEILHNQIIEKYTKDISRVLELIRMRDSLKHPEADTTENVVDVDVIAVPMLAALVDAHYQGMFTQYKRNEK